MSEIDSGAPAPEPTVPEPTQNPATEPGSSLPEPSPSPAPEPAPAEPKGTLATKPQDGEGDDPPGTWVEDWRDRLAAGDDKFRKRLDRFDSPEALARSYRELENKVRSGSIKAPLGADATPEQVAEWRKENGVPDEPTGYEVKLPNGVVFGDADKPAVDSFLTHAHGKNWGQDQVNEALEWYASHQDSVLAQQQAADDAFNAEGQEQLREVWGADFKRNLNALQNLLAGAPDGMADRLLLGRTADGRLVGDDPAVLQYLVGLAREINPTATLVPAGQDQMKGLETRIGEIETLMRDSHSPYWNDREGPKIQAEYRELITAREKMGKRAA